MKRIGRRVWLVVRTVIRAVRKAHEEQVYMWECLALSSRAAPATATGQLRWVPSLDGYRLVGSQLPTQDPDWQPPVIGQLARSERSSAHAGWPVAVEPPG